MNDFLGENDIVASVSSGYKACLEREDEVGQEGFESLDKKFCNCFVEGVAKANGSELMNDFRFIRFWNEVDEGVVEIFWDQLGSKDIFIKEMTNGPTMFQSLWKKMGWNPSGLGALWGLKEKWHI